MADTALLIARMEVSLRSMEKQMALAPIIADKGVRAIEKRFARANLKLPGGFLAGVTGALAAVSFEGLIRDARAAVATLADLNDAAQRIGVSTDAIQGLEFAVRMSGGAAGDATAGLQRFAKEISEAGTGSTYFAKVLEANGVALRDQAGNLREVEDLLRDYADLIQNASSPADALNLAVEAFGRSAGPAMVNALRNGASGLADMGREAQAAGIIIDNDLIQKAAVMDDAFTKMAASSEAFAQRLAVAIGQFAIPAVDNLLRGVASLSSYLNMDVGSLVTDPNGTIAAARLKAAFKGAGGATQLGGVGDFYNRLGFGRDFQGPPIPGRGTVLPPRTDTGGGGGRRTGGGGGRSTAESAAIAAERARDQQDMERIRALTAAAREEQERYNDAIAEVRNVADAGLGSLIDGLMEGKSAAEALNDALRDMLQSLASMAQNQLLNGLFGGGGAGGGGLLAGLFGGARPNTGNMNLFAQGGITRGPSIAGEAGPEAVVPLPDGRRIPVAMQGGGGGGVSIVVNEAPGSRVASRREEGGPNMRRIVLDIVNDHLSSGGADGPMAGRYGAKPRKVR
jgi:hypothetical protein